MPSFQPIPLDFEYTPQGLDELIVPLSLYKQEYDKRVADIDTRRDGLAAFAPYMNELSPEARARYEALNRRIEDNMQYIGKPGYLLHERPIVSLKQEYGRTVADFTNAVKNMEAQKALAVKERSSHPNLVYNFRDKDGGIVREPSLDNYLDNGTLDFVSVDADDMMNKASALAKGVSSRLAAASGGARIDRRLDPVAGHIVEWKSKESGAPVILSLDWLLHPERHSAEIERFKRQHPGREYQQLFDSSVADDIRSLKGHTAYDALDDANKARVDDAIMFGFDSGLGPYSTDTNEDWRALPQPDAGGGGGGDVIPWEPNAVKTVPQVYVADTQGTDEEEEYRDVMRYLGVDDSLFWQTGDVSMPKRLALFNGEREFADHPWLSHPHDWTEADKTVNGHDTDDDFGISDWFSPFGEDGRLLTREKFREAYGKTIDSLNSSEYLQQKRADTSVGALHYRLFNNNSTNNNGALSTWGGVYDNMSKAMLAAFEVPKEKREEILADATGGKFDKWIEENGVTEGKLKGKLLDLADKYANTQRDIQYFRFNGDNDGIFRDVLKTSVNSEDGELRMKEVTGYKFSKKDGVRRLTTETKDEELSFEELGDAKDFIYKIPADPSEGLIISNTTTGKEYLIPAEKLGNLYNDSYIKENLEEIALTQQSLEVVKADMKRLFKKTDAIYAASNLSREEKDQKLAEVEDELRLLQATREKYIDNQRRITSDIVDKFQKNLSHSYKPRQN